MLHTSANATKGWQVSWHPGNNGGTWYPSCRGGLATNQPPTAWRMPRPQDALPTLRPSDAATS